MIQQQPMREENDMRSIFKKLVFAWLKKDTRRRFTAVITDSRCAVTVRAWQKMFPDEFKRHLEKSSKEFKKKMPDLEKG